MLKKKHKIKTLLILLTSKNASVAPPQTAITELQGYENLKKKANIQKISLGYKYFKTQ